MTSLQVVANDTPTMTARETLQQAIEARDAIRLRVEGCRATCVRAQALVIKLEASLSAYDNVSAELAASKAAEFRRAMIEGLDVPTQSLTPGLSAAATEKLSAENSLDGAVQCHSALSRELSEAESELATRQSNVEIAARAVIGERVDEMCRDLMVQEKKIGEARALLMGATALRRDDGFKISPSTMAALRDGPRNMLVGTSIADRQYFDQWLTALGENANATADNEF